MNDDGEEVNIEVYTHNGTDPLPRYPTMIFMIDEDVDLSYVLTRATEEMEPPARRSSILV